MSIKKACTVIMMVTLFTVVLVAQQYDYPIKPGTPEWKAMISTEQRVQACQIPDSILTIISTEDLLSTCLNHPFNIDLVLFNFVQDGFNNIKNKSNAWRELLKREDLGPVVIIKYKTMSPDSMIGEEYPGRHFLLMETLLIQDEVINTLSKKDRFELLRESYIKYSGKVTHPEKYELFGTMNNIALMGKILIKENYIIFLDAISGKKGLKKKIEFGAPCTKEEKSEILKHVEEFLKAQ